MTDYEVGHVVDGRVSWLGPDEVELVSSVKISKKQWDILRFLSLYQQQERQSPSMEEIGWMVGLNQRSSVQYHIEQLERKGLISRAPGANRAIVLNVSL